MATTVTSGHDRPLTRQRQFAPPGNISAGQETRAAGAVHSNVLGKSLTGALLAHRNKTRPRAGEPGGAIMVVMDDDRQARIDAGFTLARALGHHEAREALHRLGYDSGFLVPLNLGGLEQHLPPEAVAQAAYELAMAAPEDRDAITAGWRATAEAYANPELLAALTRDSHEDGGRVTLPEA